MQTCQVEFPLQVGPERFWELYLDPEFMRRMFVDGLGWNPPTIEEDREVDGRRHRRISATPRLQVSGRVAKIIGDRLGYTETAQFDLEAERWSFSHATNVFGSRLDLGGEMWVRPVADDRGQLCARVDMNCRVPLVGGLLEKAIELNVRKGYAQSAEYINRVAGSRTPRGT